MIPPFQYITVFFYCFAQEKKMCIYREQVQLYSLVITGATLLWLSTSGGSHRGSELILIGAFPCYPYAFPILICIRNAFVHTN